MSTSWYAKTTGLIAGWLRKSGKFLVQGNDSTGFFWLIFGVMNSSRSGWLLLILVGRFISSPVPVHLDPAPLNNIADSCLAHWWILGWMDESNITSIPGSYHCQLAHQYKRLTSIELLCQVSHCTVFNWLLDTTQAACHTILYFEFNYHMIWLSNNY